MTPARPELHVLRAGPSDAERILPILQAAFASWPAVQIDVPPLDHLRWKLEGAPGGPPFPHTLVMDGDELVAVQVRWRGHAHVGDQVFPFDRGADLAVHPDHQGKGVARRIFDDDEVRNPSLGDFIRWDLPSNDARVLHLEGEAITMRTLRVWTRAFAPRAFIGAHLRGGGALHLAASVARATASRLRPRGRGNRKVAYEVSDLTTFDARTDALWDAARGQFDLAKRRDAAFMNWRHLDPRSGRAAALAASLGDEVVAYVVYKQRDSSGSILELVAHPQHQPAAHALLDAASARLRAAGCNSVTCSMSPGHPLEPALRAAHFLDTGAPQSLMIDHNWMAGAADAVALIRSPGCRMHVTLGDFDFI